MKKKELLTTKTISRVYESYLAAKDNFPPEATDADIRRPDLLKDRLVLADKSRTAVVTGSKGKGSIARLLAAVLGTCGKCGLFISPHVIDFNERISIDNRCISDEDLEKYVSYALEAAEKCDIDPEKGEYVSPIGILAAATVGYFNDSQCDFTVFECGRGAKYDDVNRIPHEYAVIGTIFLEHSAKLGKSIEDIARDKACVITEDTKLVYSMPQNSSVLQIIEERAKEMGAELLVCGRDFETGGYDLSLLGSYQSSHAEIALRLGRAMMGEMTDFDGIAAESAMKKVTIPGRMEVLSENPFIFMDCAINRQSAKEVAAYLSERKIFGGNLILCLPDDKDFIGVTRELAPCVNKIFLSKVHHPHYPMEVDQRKKLAETGIDTIFENDFKMAVARALEHRRPVVIVCANTFVHIIKDFVQMHNLNG